MIRFFKNVSKVSMLLALFLLSLCLLTGNSSAETQRTTLQQSKILPTEKIASTQPKKIRSIFGIDVLQDKKFSSVKGKKLGLLTNASGGNNRGEKTVDILLNSKACTLKAVFFPEHDGDFKSDILENLKKNNVPTYCTHTEESRLPKDEWLKGIDLMVIDMQGFGMRYYTFYASALYIACACFKQKIPVLILDRPNPLGEYLGGPAMHSDYVSFLGTIPNAPLFYPLTIAEFLNFAKNCGKPVNIICRCGSKNCTHGVTCDVNTLKKGELQVIKAQNYRKRDTFLDIGLYQSDSSIELSPHVANVSSIFEYAILSLATLAGEDSISYLKVIENPQNKGHFFKYFYSPYISNADLLKALKKYPKSLKGCDVSIVKIGVENSPTLRECLCLSIKNFKETAPALLSLVLLAECQEIVPVSDWETFEKQQKSSSSKPERNLEKLTVAQQNALRKAKWDRLTKLQKELFQKHAGDQEFINKMFNGESIDVNYFHNKWERSATSFRNDIKKYYLY